MTVLFGGLVEEGGYEAPVGVACVGGELGGGEAVVE
jgi:hypothetical protein